MLTNYFEASTSVKQVKLLAEHKLSKQKIKIGGQFNLKFEEDEVSDLGMLHEACTLGDYNIKKEAVLELVFEREPQNQKGMSSFIEIIDETK